MHPNIYSADAYPDSPESRIRKLSGYAAALTAMDRGIGRLIDALEEQGHLDDTLIVFTSDNGMSMGHHGVYGKGNGTDPINLYETSVRVPGIIVHRNRMPPALLEGIYSHYDFLPTIMSAFGLAQSLPDGLPGRDISPVLYAERPEESGYAVVFDEYGPNRMIRKGNWKYVQRRKYEDCELYDLIADPYERTNLISDLSAAQIRKNLERQLNEWFSKYSVPGLEGMTLNVRGGGQIDHLARRRTDLPIFTLHDGRFAPGQ